MAETFIVEVCYAGVDGLERVAVRVDAGFTIQQAIQASGLMERLSGRYALDWSKNGVGIFGKLKTLETHVRAGDRIEIYRPLQTDPNAARLRRAEKNRKTKVHTVAKNRCPI